MFLHEAQKKLRDRIAVVFSGRFLNQDTSEKMEESFNFHAKNRNYLRVEGTCLILMSPKGGMRRQYNLIR